jgi:hypothetical protein
MVSRVSNKRFKPSSPNSKELPINRLGSLIDVDAHLPLGNR